MTESLAMALNLIGNATFSFVVGLVIVGFSLWFFRIETGPWKLFLLSLPFVKLVYDTVRGLPSNSVLLTGLNPFGLPPKHQVLQIGAGLSQWGPKLDVTLSVRDVNGKEFAASVGDYVAFWLGQVAGREAVAVLLGVVFAISAVLLAIRIIFAWRFEKRRRRDRSSARRLRIQSLGYRKVDVYTSDGFSGTPFTGGVLAPYICITHDALAVLTADEVEAVIAHELAHVRKFDVAVNMTVQLLGDLFWFVPGYKWLGRKIDDLREIVADQWAIEAGTQPALLASALVRLKDASTPFENSVLYSAFFRKPSLLKLRIERLLGRTTEPRARFGWDVLWIRSLLSAAIFMAVMLSTFGGNQHGARIENPEWFEAALQRLLGS